MSDLDRPSTDSPTPQTESAVPVVPEGAETLQVVDVRRGAFGVSGTGDTSGFGGLTQAVVLPGSSPRPYGGWFDEAADLIEAHLGSSAGTGPIDKIIVDRGELTIVVAREAWAGLARHLRDDPRLRFEFCSSVSGVHYPGDTGREHHIAAHLVSMTHRRRLRLETTCPDADPHVPSLVATYPTADWHERETWDMFGVIFDGHPALTRILMPDDWPGHPQRKDYPLGGIPVEFKGATVPPPDQRRRYV